MVDYYGTPEEAVAYHAARGNAAWAASTDELRLAALIRGAKWLDATYRNRFPGVRSGGRSQSLEWPRKPMPPNQAYNLDPQPIIYVDLILPPVFDNEGNSIAVDEIPVEMIHANYEAALRELDAPGSLSPDFVASERVTSEKVGDLAATYSDRVMSAAEMRPVATVIDDILSSLLAPQREVLFGGAARG